MLLEGIFPAVTTPFHADGRPHWHNLERNVERYSRTPAAGLVLMGSTGEAAMLSDEESRHLLHVAKGAAAQDKVLIAGVGRESVSETLHMIEEAAKQDYDVALVRTPHFYRPQMRPAEMLNYYRIVADQSPLPVLLYSVPVYTQYDLPVEIAAELAHHPNIIGMKDSSGKVERIRELVAQTAAAPRHHVTVTTTFSAVTGRMQNSSMVAAGLGSALMPADMLGTAELLMPFAPSAPQFKTRTREVGFQVLCGSAQALLPSLNAGATGGVLAMAAFAPQACAEIHMAWKDKDAPLAEEKQARVMQAAEVVCGRMGVPGVKYGCDLNGYYGGAPRLPLLPLNRQEKAQVEELLHDLKQ
ncbi:MAG: dihydrodipicolinate synthase family protein [Acidobacteriaceae bacterium]